MRATRRGLAGRRITDYLPRPFSDGRGGTAHDPAIVLDDGSVLTFSVEETNVGDYGVRITRTKPVKK